MTVKQLYSLAKNELQKAGIQTPAFDSMCLIEHCLHIDNAHFLIKSDCEADSKSEALFLSCLEKRKSGEPLQYIIGEWEFMGLPFKVGSGVLIPRADTEILCETVIDIVGNSQAEILDLCAGSGAIAISLAHFCKNARVTAVEKYDDALQYLKINVQLNNAQVEIIKGDVLQSADDIIQGRKFDIITCNPPYIDAEDMKKLQQEVTHEPQTALFGGEDGLDFYRIIPKIWKNNLRSGGLIIFEIGINQQEDVKNILLSEGFADIFMRKDLNGIIRVVGGRKI